jgi:hypothetical protein
MVWLQWVLFFVSVALQVYVIALLRRGPYKDYPFALIYSLVLLLTSAADALALAGVLSLSKPEQRFFYYRNDAVRQFLLFVVVVSLIERAMQGSPYRKRVRVVLGGLAVLSVFISLTVHSGAPRFVLWMTEVSRDLSFGSVALTLLLWTLLISSPRKDHQLLLVTGGLGLQFTGEAIGQSLRQLSHHHHVILFVGNLLMSVAHLLRLYVWMEAFGRREVLPQIQEEPGGNVSTFHNQAQKLFCQISPPIGGKLSS